MSSAGTVQVNITARETELRAELALARADLAQFTGQVRTMSAEMVATGKTADAAMVSGLRAAATGAGNAAKQVSVLQKGLKAAVPEEFHASISTATRETRALFDELTSGRTRMTPGTLAIIAQRVFGLSGAALASIGAVAALAGGLAYLAYNALQAAEAVGKIHLAGDFAGGMQMSKQQVQDLINTLTEIPGVSRTAAEEIVSDFTKAGITGTTELTGLSEAANRYAEVMGGEPPEAAKKFAEILDTQKSSVTELQKVFPGLSTTEAENFIAIQKNGDAHQTAAALMQLVADKSKNLTQEWASNSTGLSRLWSNFQIYLGTLQGVRSFEEGHEAVIKTNTQLYEEQTKAILADAAALRGKKPDTSAAFAKDVEASSRSTHGRIDELHDAIKRFQADLANPSATEAQKANFKSMIDDDQREIEGLQKRGVPSVGKLTGFGNAGAEAIANARQTISEIQANDQLGAQQREKQEMAVWQNVLATAKLNAAQRVEIQREMNGEIAQANRAEATQRTAIDRDNASTSLELAHIGFQEKRDLLEQEVQAGDITKQEEIARLKATAQAELQANLEMLSSTEKTKEDDLAAWTRTENRKRVLVAQTAAEVAKLDLQMAAAAKKAADQDAQAWKMTTDEITGAERTMVGDLLGGRKSFYQSAAQASSQFIQKEIENDLVYYTKKLLLGAEGAAADKAFDQSGIIVHMLGETQKTSATAAGTATRTALQGTETAAENVSFLTRVGRWVASELGMTTATTTGVATRTTAAAAAATAQKTAESAANVASAQSYAAVAATGAASAVAPIPIVGPELAVAAAASTMAAMQPFVGLAALDVGAWNVPHDMPALIHKGESVVPKTFAEGLRSGGGFGSAGNNTTNTLNMHYSPTINAPQQKSLGQMLSDDGSTLRAWFGAQIRSGALRLR